MYIYMYIYIIIYIYTYIYTLINIHMTLFLQPSSPDHIKYPMFWELNSRRSKTKQRVPLEDILSYRGRGISLFGKETVHQQTMGI